MNKLNVRTALCSIVNRNTGKYCSVAFIRMVILYDFIHRLKTFEAPCTAQQERTAQ